ncbi:MAG: SRPBCC domain-containing protein [Alphaproteobacteria bacterium]
MTEINDGVINREIFIDAPRETVFGFLVDPEKMVQWMGVDAIFENRPGGTYRVNVSGADVALGEVIEVVPHERVVFTWGWEGGDILPPGGSRIKITLANSGAGTKLRLVHSDIPESLVDRHGDGWDHFIPRLAIAGAGGDPGPDPWVKENAAQ